MFGEPKTRGVFMFSNYWLRIASGVSLLVAVVLVVAQSMLRDEWGHKLYYGTTLIAVFGYIFLTSRSEGDDAWWW
jgi:hypothetical protein